MAPLDPAVPRDARDGALIPVAYETQLRRSNVVALTVQQVSWERDGTATVLIQKSKHVLQGLERVRERAKAFRKERFTALLHHVDVGFLTPAYFWLKKDAAPGIDGMTWAQYGEDLAVRLKDLHCRVHRATG